jgi:uncharacterized protein (TIGR02453 family)
MKKSSISPSTMTFLSDLRDNNNRPWFDANKERYEVVKEESKKLLIGIEAEMNKVDKIESTKLFRIYRDVRFSKDKTPYNYHLSMSLSRQKPYFRGGYYLRIMPENTVLACGFWNPNSSDLSLIREHIASDDATFRKAVKSTSIKNILGEMEGDAVKTTPKGYNKDHSAIDLLRYKQFLFSKSFSDKEVISANFLDDIIEGFKAVRPFFDYMSDILSHNLNGEPLY